MREAKEGEGGEGRQVMRSWKEASVPVRSAKGEGSVPCFKSYRLMLTPPPPRSLPQLNINFLPFFQDHSLTMMSHSCGNTGPVELKVAHRPV